MRDVIISLSVNHDIHDNLDITTITITTLHSATMDDDNNRLFVFSRPHWLNNANTRTAGIYLSGALVRPCNPPSCRQHR